MYQKIAVVAAIIVMFSIQISLAGPDVRDGTWEITAKMEMPGMPMEMPAATFSQCLTDQDNIPVNRNEMKDCRLLSSQVDGNVAKWVMQCTQGGETVKSRGRITYTGDTFDGVVNISMQGMEITQKMKGRRTGPCK